MIANYEIIDDNFLLVKVVRKVNSGEWSTQTYLEYQRFAAGSGNVDSASLLLNFGVAASIFGVTLGEDSNIAKLFISAVECNFSSFFRLLDEEKGSLYLLSDDDTSLLHAASYGGCAEIVKFITDNAGLAILNAVGVNGVTAVMAAAAMGYGDVVRILVGSSADVNIVHKFAGNTALHMAAEMNQAAAIIVLCELGANVDLLTSNNSTALHVAAHSNASGETILALIKNCRIDSNSLMNQDTTALYLAAQFGYTDTVIALIENGADHSFAMPYSPYTGGTQTLVTYSKIGREHIYINSEPGNGAQAIHAAAENGHASTVLALLNKGVDVNSYSMGVTPLHLAAQYNRRDVAKVLISYHADVDILSSHDGSTALYYACGHGFEEIVHYLISAQALVSKAQRSGGFPLLYASMTGQRSIVNQLLNAQADPTQQAPDGLTPLHAAATTGSISIMAALLSYVPKSISHSNLEKRSVYRWSLLLIRGPDRQSLLHCAVLNNKLNMVRYLLQIAAKYTTEERSPYSLKDLIDLESESDGGSALHYASRKGYTEIVDILVAYGSDVRKVMNTDSLCVTPLYLAVHSGSLIVVRTLMSAAPDADAALCGKNKATPLLAAIEKGNTAIVQALLHPPPSRYSDIGKNKAVGEEIQSNGESFPADKSRSEEILELKGIL